MKHSKIEVETESKVEVEIEKEDKNAMMPEIKVEVEPKIEIEVEAPDMTAIADAIKSIKQNIIVTVEEPPEKAEKLKVFDIEVTERDGRGGIKKLRLTEVKDV